ncbi:hypothetical protein ACFCV8_29110 [Streptomyces sp. NPDC056347]|uniref:hypothetical protein n=1 Tax=Streptomyces sp. NPDC056347 TaxID=3345790 RepID=UPI0035DD6E3B
MAEVEELLDGVVVRLPDAGEIRRRGQRRRARRRAGVAALCTAALLAGGAWVLLPDGAGRQHERGGQVAVAPDNPFLVNGVVRTLPPGEVPLNDTWHWKQNEGRSVDSDSRGDLLNWAGISEFCPAEAQRTRPVSSAGYTVEYRGVRKAVARQCIVEYDDGATARQELLSVLTGLEANGLSRVPVASTEVPKSDPDRVPEGVPDEWGDKEGTMAWAGKVPGGHTLRVFTQRWKSWVSVVEIVDGDS